MGQARFAGQDIQSWTPALDIRSLESGKLFVLDGRNYRFDSKGVKAGFGSRMLHGGSIGGLVDTQSLDVGGRTFVLNDYGVWQQKYANDADRDSLLYSTHWERLIEFEIKANQPFATGRWTGAYLANGIFVAHPYHGLLKVKLKTAALHTADGVPANPIAVAEVGGRLVVLNSKIIAWSGPGDANDFSPALGGAGFQELKAKIGGAPVALTTYANGCIVWTQSAGMVCEFIGGDAVFRFDTLSSKLFPLGPMAIAQMVDGTVFMATRHGIVRYDGENMANEFVPYFNEFFRDELAKNPRLKVRLDYIVEEDTLYVQIWDALSHYIRTYVLAVALDKWGRFDEQHQGICRFGPERGVFGYVSKNGFAHKFVESPDRETENRTLVGLDSSVTIGYFNEPGYVAHSDTILEMQELSISARESMPPDAIVEVEDWDGDGSHWDSLGQDPVDSEDWNAQDYVYDESPLIEAATDEDWGYAADPYDADWNDPSYAEDLTVLPGGVGNDADWHLSLLESESITDPPEDWNSELLADEDYAVLPIDGSVDWTADTVVHTPFSMPDEDYSDPATGIDFQWANGSSGVSTQVPDEDWGSMPFSTSLDWQLAGYITYSEVDSYEDWMHNSGDEEWHGRYDFLNDIDYDIEIHSSFNGFDDDINTVPELAMEQYKRDLWVAITSGRFQSVTLSANQRWQKYHITALDATLFYQGHYS